MLEKYNEAIECYNNALRIKPSDEEIIARKNIVLKRLENE